MKAAGLCLTLDCCGGLFFLDIQRRYPLSLRAFELFSAYLRVLQWWRVKTFICLYWVELLQNVASTIRLQWDVYSDVHMYSSYKLHFSRLELYHLKTARLAGTGSRVFCCLVSIIFFLFENDRKGKGQDGPGSKVENARRCFVQLFWMLYRSIVACFVEVKFYSYRCSGWSQRQHREVAQSSVMLSTKPKIIGPDHFVDRLKPSWI